MLPLLALTGCKGREFNLQFELPADVSTTYTAIYYASDSRQGVMVENVAVVTDGKGKLTGPCVNPMVLYLSMRRELPAVIYVEKGDNIKITGPGSDPYTWSVGGNKINETLSAWRNANAKVLASGNTDSINTAVARFVLQNPDDPCSPLLLLTAFDRRADETRYRQLWQGLPGRDNKERWAAMVARADQPSATLRTPGRVKSLPLRSLAHGTDTIRPDSVRATLLYFWNNGNNRRKEGMDSLKKVGREFPDSARRMIADICLDADSLSWRSPLRQDSVAGAGISRLWAPAGLADRLLMQLPVPRTPFFIVIGQDGHQRYRGDNPADALNAFRTTIKVKP